MFPNPYQRTAKNIRSEPLNDEMNQLVIMQEVDAELAGFAHEVSEQEEEINKRERTILEKKEVIKLYYDKITSLKEKKLVLTTEYEDAGIRVKNRQNKMMQVQTSREHQALLKEIEESKRVIKENEEQLLKIMEEMEEAESKVTELENLLVGEETLLGEQTAIVAKKIKKITSKRKTVTTKRNKLAKVLDESLLKRYDMLIKKRNGLAVAKAISGVCQGCHMSVPPQLFNEILKSEKLHFCPTCQRVIYFEEEVSEEA